ncbi:YvrJ family protein [Ureibacillus sp. 179-F W5.1 NHS]|uniref:YvrJ family protein n=2 Tax=Bacillales TaxID=1385 RepID=A0A3M8HG11_9BACI|nr:MULTISPECIES: YvrJ family protein [Bacillales]MBD8027853.1 YvrJ family protein [Ureibacillus galli]RND01416.1 YvrJ family protein [Lysinibacillus halotolerans]
MQEWVSLVQEIGFPILVSFYLLYRIETKLDAIHTAIISMHQN